MAKDSYFYALGRRKRATARVRLQSGKGSIIINDKPALEYFSGSEYLLEQLKRPFAVIEKDSFDVTVKVDGGGITGQVDAIALGISKTLALMNEDLKGTLKRAELLGRDPREKERKKLKIDRQ
jgi:small subunit ribosomal protein S9